MSMCTTHKVAETMTFAGWHSGLCQIRKYSFCGLHSFSDFTFSIDNSFLTTTLTGLHPKLGSTDISKNLKYCIVFNKHGHNSLIEASVFHLSLTLTHTRAYLDES